MWTRSKIDLQRERGKPNRCVDFVMLRHFHFLVLIAPRAKGAVVLTERTVQPEATVQNSWYGGLPFGPGTSVRIVLH